MNLFFIGIDVSKETIDVGYFEPHRMRKPRISNYMYNMGG